MKLINKGVRLPDHIWDALPAAAEKHMGMTAAEALRFCAIAIVDGRLKIDARIVNRKPRQQPKEKTIPTT